MPQKPQQQQQPNAKKKKLTAKQKQLQQEQLQENEEYANRPLSPALQESPRPLPPALQEWGDLANWDAPPDSSPPAHHGSAMQVPYTLGMIYVAEKDAQIRLGKEIKSKIVRVGPGKAAADLVLEKDELIQVPQFTRDLPLLVMSRVADRWLVSCRGSSWATSTPAESRCRA